jgi:rod shape-determining protein MreC
MIAAGLALLAIATLYVGDDTQQRITQAFQASVLRPFIWTQETLAQARIRADQIDYLQSDVDSLTAVLSTQAALVDENRSLRDLLGLSERAGPAFLRATLIRPGGTASESMFWVDKGEEDGMEVYAAVINAHGLVGRILEVRAHTAVGMDWTHPDFRASAMLEDGSVYGMVENARGQFREDDRLLLNGTAYHENLARGAPVLTSGLGGTFPRGIPIGLIDETAEEQGTWRKSYWMRPSVEPASVTHVLVAAVDSPGDVANLWPSDTTTATLEGTARDPGS